MMHCTSHTYTHTYICTHTHTPHTNQLFTNAIIGVSHLLLALVSSEMERTKYF